MNNNTQQKSQPAWIFADVIVYSFAHLHTALRTEGNILDAIDSRQLKS